LFGPGELFTVEKLIERIKSPVDPLTGKPRKYPVSWWDIEYLMKSRTEYQNNPRKQQELINRLRQAGIELDKMPVARPVHPSGKMTFEKWIAQNCKFAQPSKPHGCLYP
jgi:hypothetical protein